MNFRRYLLVAISCFMATGALAQSGKEAELFINRYKEFLYKTDSTYQSFKDSPALSDSGRWADLNYSDNQPTRWQLLIPLTRLKAMALAWNDKSSVYYHDPSIKKKMELVLDDWFKHRYISKNWWHNEIGVPQKFRDIIILMRDSLDEVRIRKSMQVLAQHRVKGTGANLIWSADLGLHYGVLINNPNLIKKCRDTILSVIKITSGEGIQQDYSFHQHGKRLQMYQYGRSYLFENLRLAWQLKDLSYAFPESGLKILGDFIFEGWQWMARGIHTVPGTMDRAASRRQALHAADLRTYLPILYDLFPGRKAEISKLEFNQNNAASPEGYRYFPFSDFTAVHRKEFSFFLKTISTRTLATESINEENLKGELLNAGDTYFISNGTEYYNLLPFWDWDRIPGITNFSGDRKNKIRTKPFTGNVSDGTNGLAVMDYELVKNEQFLGAKKFYASWKNVTVILTALKTRQLRSYPFTAMDQSRLNGPVTINNVGNTLDEGTHSFVETKWVHHHNFLYFPLSDDRLGIEIKKIMSRWSLINKAGPSNAESETVFLPTLTHYQLNTGYAVIYEPDVKKAAAYFASPSWKLLRNDTIAQSVQFADSTIMTAIYQPGSTTISENLEINTSRPLLIYMKDGIYVSDPAHGKGKVRFAINRRQYTANLKGNGESVAAILLE